MLLASVGTGEAVTKAEMAIILGLVMPNGVVAEPKVLADRELDSITAAGVLVDVDSIAAALGTFADARTDANTFAFDGEDFDVGIGITTGQALSCCGEGADVEVGSTVLGTGELVHGVTHAVKNDSSGFARGFSMGFVLALSDGPRLGDLSPGPRGAAACR